MGGKSMSSFTKKEQIVILIVVLIFIFILGFKTISDKILHGSNPLGLIEDDQAIIAPVLLEDEESYDPIIMIHISGAVYNSGIYELVTGDRVIDAVNLAGGLTKEADLDRINLAKKVADEEKIYIPKIGEETNSEIQVNTVYSSIPSEIQSDSGKININTGSMTELDSLPGIGEAIAQRIIEYRSTSPFRSIEEIKNVSGIGDKKYESIKDLITVK